LLELDVSAFHRILAAMRACVAAHDRPDESEDIFASRMQEIYTKGPKGLMS